MLNEVLLGLDYGVRLTPGSKDGGKDLVVRCLRVSKKERYYVEIKHWRAGNAPGEKVVKKFAKVLIKDKVRKGLILSSSGFTQNAFDDLSAEELNLVACGGQKKIHSLCQYYKAVLDGLLNPPKNPATLLFKDTTSPLLIPKAG